MREEVREALEHMAEQGIVLTGPEEALDTIEVGDGFIRFTSDDRPTISMEAPGDRPERWWHCFVTACPHLGGNVTVYLGPERHPEQLIADGITAFPVHENKGPECFAHYYRSWDHEPTPEDKRVVEDANEERYAEFWAEHEDAEGFE